METWVTSYWQHRTNALQPAMWHLGLAFRFVYKQQLVLQL